MRACRKVVVFLGILISLILLLKISDTLAAGTNPLGGKTVYSPSGTWKFPNIRAGHPRIYFEGQADVTKLRARIDTIPEIKAVYNDLRVWADKQTTVTIMSAGNDSQLPDVLLNIALLTLMEREKGNDYSYYLTLTKYMITNLPPPASTYKSYDVQALAAAYDWLFDEYSLIEKQSCVQKMISRGKQLASLGYMFKYPNAAPTKSQLGVLMTGIAFYNDGIDNQMAIDIINYYGEFTAEIWVPLLTIMSGTTGGTNQAKNYFGDGAATRSSHLEMWKSSTGRDLHIGNSYNKYYSYWDIYAMRPDNSGTKLNSTEVNVSGLRYSANYPLLASIYKDPLTSFFAAAIPGSSLNRWKYIIWYDPSIPSQSYESLPLTRLFDGTGDVIMRTGWNFGSYNVPSNDTFARFKSGDYYRSNEDRNQNDFVIFHKGSLASENPKGRSAINHNTIIIDDEDQRGTTSVYSALSGDTPKAIRSKWGENTPSDVADLIKIESTSQYDYMLGNATNAYNPAKLSHFTREFVFLRPNYFVVFDRVNTTSSTYSKKYLLHSINVPRIGGITPPDGTSTYSSDLIQIDRGGTSSNGKPGMNGRLFSKTLLPVNNKITVVGSGQTPDLTNKKEPARWRMEVEPSTPKGNDLFLHVMQVGDSDTLKSMTPTSRIDANTMKGAFINDPTTPEIVMFSSHPQGADVTSVTYQANYASSLAGKHLLLDMSPGTYDVYKNGTIILSGITASSQGVLSFSSTGGSTFQVVQTGSTPTEDTTSPSNPTNLTATTISSSQINLSWNASTDNVGVAGYKIFRNGMQITTATNTAYSDTSLSPSTTYTYAVSAYDATANESGQSNQVTATTLSKSSQDTESPSTPTSLSATTISSSQINLFWDASTDNVGVAGYKIFRNGTQITTATNTTYSDTILFPSTTYTYAVSAYDAAGNESTKSTFVSATTLADTNPPTISSVSASGDSTIVTIVFNESVEQASAINASNYQINNGITVVIASLGSDLKTVTITTSSHGEDIIYTLTVNNVKDRATNPNTIAPNTTASYQYVGMNTFDADSEGWAYFDDTFRSTTSPSSADGQWDAGGALSVALGGGTNNATSGGWAKSVSITESGLPISFDYKLDLLGGVDGGEYGEVIVSVDGNQVGILSNDFVEQLEGNGQQVISTGWVTITVTAANVGAGSHEVIIGGYMSSKTSASNEKAVVYIDNVRISASAPIDTTPPAIPTGLTVE